VRRFATLACSLAFAAGASPPALADSTSPGKESAFESASIAPLPVGDGVLLTASLVKGKKKRVVAIEATLATNSGASGVLHLLPTVNGVAVQGTIVNEPCDPSLVHCAATGTWWLDVDAAEAANPGLFVGELLEVELVGGLLAGGDSDASGTATLSVRMVKK